MAWHQSGNKPLSEPMMVSLLMQICVAQPQSVNPVNWNPPANKVDKSIMLIYHQTSNISHILVGNKIVDHSNVVGASPVGAAHDDIIKWKHFPRYWPFVC